MSQPVQQQFTYKRRVRHLQPDCIVRWVGVVGVPVNAGLSSGAFVFVRP